MDRDGRGVLIQYTWEREWLLGMVVADGEGLSDTAHRLRRRERRLEGRRTMILAEIIVIKLAPTRLITNKQQNSLYSLLEIANDQQNSSYQPYEGGWSHY